MTERQESTHIPDRFKIDHQSAEMIGSVCSGYTELKEEYPYLQGLGFFGSRVIGKQSSGSDLDICIYLDRSDVGYSRTCDEILIMKLEDLSGVEIGRHPGLVVDVSREGTEEAIGNYLRLTESVRYYPQEKKIAEVVKSHEASNLFSRFFLHFGDGIEKNRKFVLDELEEYAGPGDFELLMRGLAYFEQYRMHGNSEEFNFENYPTTIEEARKIF